MNQKLIAVSDTHCHFRLLEQIIEKETREAPGALGVLHCGDLGFFDEGSPTRLPPREYHLIRSHDNPIEESFEYLAGRRSLPLPLYVIPGNHEDFEIVRALASGIRALPGVTLLAPGKRAVLSLGGRDVTVMGLGRILPDGLSWRKRGEAKYIKEEDLEKTLQAALVSPPDILLLHEPPCLARKRSFGSSALSELIEKAAPKVVLAGHMHFEYSVQLGGTAVHGLGYGVRGRYAVMDSDLTVTFKDLADHPPAPVDVVPVARAAERARAMTEEQRAQARRSELQRASLPIGGKELCQHFDLGRLDKGARRHLERLFAALRQRMVAQGGLSREEALAQAEAFLREQGLFDLEPGGHG
ncbi:MAG: metallophosphoesterase [Planctomycetota bacterium]